MNLRVNVIFYILYVCVCGAGGGVLMSQSVINSEH